MSGGNGIKKRVIYVTVFLTIFGSGILMPTIFATDRFYTHFFYIAIALTTVWYPRYSIFVGILFGVEHIAAEFLLHGTLSRTNVIRAIVIVMISGILSKIWEQQHKYDIQIEKLSFESKHDSLTKVFNRSYFYDILQKDLSVPTAIFMCDMDNLKVTNDRFGHAVGDILIIEMAEFLGNMLREGDTLARLGGDEFGMIIEECDRKKAEAFMELMEKQLFEYNKKKEEHLKLTFSVGFSICVDGRDPYKTMKQADRAMYLEKLQKKEIENMYMN